MNKCETEKEDSSLKNKQSIKLFLILLLCSTYIFSFSHFGASAYDSFMNKSRSFDEGTIIGTVNIAGRTKAEARTIVHQQWTNWQNETTIQVHYKEKTEVFDNTLFTYMEKETFNGVKEGQMNEPIIHLQSLETFLLFLSPTLTNDVVNIEKLKNDFLLKAKSFETGTVDIQLADYLLDPTKEQNNRVGEIALSTKLSADEKNLINNQFGEIKLTAMSQFSMIQHVEEIGMQQLSPELLSVLATGIYQLILPTNFSINEREISEELPNYAQLGFEAKVNLAKNKDLVFLNGNESSYKIIIKAKEDQVVFSLLGPSFLQQYKVITKGQQNFKPKTIVQFNPELSSTQKIVEQEGKDGESTTVVREIYSENGELVNTETISEDYYPPVHRVEVHGLIKKQSDTNTGDNTTNTTDTQTSDSVDSATSEPTRDANSSSSTEAENNRNDGEGNEKSAE